MKDDPMPPEHVSSRRIFGLLRPHWKALSAVLGLIIIAGIAGAVAPFLVRGIVDDALPARDFPLLWLLAGGILAIAVFNAAAQVVQAYISTSVGQQIMHDLRSRLYEHLQSLSLAFFSSTRTGDIQARISSDITRLQSLLTNTATDLARHVSAAGTTVIAMLLLDWRLALASLVVLPLLLVINKRVALMRERIMDIQQERVADLSANITESLSAGGFILSRTMGRTRDLVRRFRQDSADLAKLETRSNTAGQWEFALVFLILDMLPAVTFIVGGLFLSYGLEVSLGTMVAFIALQEQLLWPLIEIFETRIEFGKGRALLRRVFAWLDTPPGITEPKSPVKLQREQFSGEITFEKVTLSYQPDADPVLSDLSFHIKPGQHIAIVGPTGSGKSSIGYLLARLYDPDKGRVLYDGIDVRQLSFANLAELLGVVSQDPFLFNTTIEENLRFACPEATEAEIATALEQAQLSELVSRLPDGLQTRVGERGYQFSGGERQRLALARALLRRPKVLLLDEATSALDAETQSALIRAVSEGGEQRTIVSIAHRLSTIRQADRIIVLRSGHIVEAGTHDELVARNGDYAAMVREE